MRLNLGCGEDNREGYINVDIAESADADVVADIGDLPFDDNSVSQIVAQDVLEHTAEPIEWLREWYRVLEEGGELYVRVPDWEKIQETRFWKETPFKRTENRVLGGREDEYDQHKCLFTKKVLRERLSKAGFDRVVIKQLRKHPLHWHLAGFGLKQ